ncbi:unnamed protein product, partial [Ranitomeya imitator]
MERLHFQGAAGAIDDYVQYRRIVGEDDGGKMFTPEEYEAYKKTVLPTRAQNRLFVSWRSPTGIDCKLVGPETPCFCTHSHTSWIYEPHVMDLRATRHGSTSHTSWIYEPHVMDLRATRHGSTSHTSWTHEPHLMDPTHIGEPRFKECRHLEQKDTRYKQHKTDFKELPKDRPILLPCKVSKCPCKSYHYAPLNGSQPIRCRCKHFADDHSVTGSYNCTK